MFRKIALLSAVISALAFAAPVVAGESCCSSKESKPIAEVAKADLPVPAAEAKGSEKTACCDDKQDAKNKTADTRQSSGCTDAKKDCSDKAKTETASAVPCDKSTKTTVLEKVAASGDAKPCCDAASKSVEVAKAD